MCTFFQGASNSLCTNAVAAFTRRLCTSYIDPSIISAFMACRLIPLDERPGVRPIGICEVVRRIIGKAIVHVLHRDICRAARPLQVFVGQPAGAEAAIHAMSTLYSDPETEAVLLVDATNAFNLLNRQAALLNMHVLCPSIATCLTNIYPASTQLFVGGET